VVGVESERRGAAFARLRSLLHPFSAFDAGITVAGVVVTIIVAASWWQSRELHPHLLAAVPVVAIMAAFPLKIMRPAGDVEIGFDFGVLVFLLLVAPAPEALGLWILGTALSQATNGKIAATRLFNFGLVSVNGWLTLLIIHGLAPGQRTGPRELAVVVAACTAYFVFDLLVTGCSLALVDGAPLRTTLFDSSAPLSLMCFVGIESLGYIAVFLYRTEPWLMPLLAAPLVTVLVCVGAFRRANTAAVLLSGLLDGAVSAHTAATAREVEQVLVAQVRRVLRCPSAEVRRTAPRPGDLGVALPPDGDEECWLIAPARPTGTFYDEQDRRALEMLGSIAAESMARVQLANEMVHVARHDSLTGLPNRALFNDRVAHAISSRRRDNRPVAVLFCDLDGFKSINDQYGHEAGDELLSVVGRRLRGCIRPGDTVARLGGDEFAVLLGEMIDPAAAREVSERIIDAVRRPATLLGHEVGIGVSIGIALHAGSEDAEALLRNADLAMYRAKALGKNRYEVFEPSMHLRVIERLELETELRKALALDQLRLVYQPVVALRTGLVTGFESLLRWHHPVHGVVDPSRFIGIAEDNGLIGPIGEWVLQQAYDDACRWSATFGQPLSIGVNVSGRQLADGALVEQVARLRTADTPDVRLILEITESVLVGDDEQSIAVLGALRDAGVRLAIDDFGTGYSSIGYLHRLPIDILKIDRSFVGGIALGGRLAALVDAILAMGRSLDLTMVAEGIEQIGQVAALRGIGCELGQGYLFARPMPASEVEAFLAASPLDVAPELTRLTPRHPADATVRRTARLT
jgi:diguanylate cyclase (GGDEF)-like protein